DLSVTRVTDERLRSLLFFEIHRARALDESLLALAVEHHAVVLRWLQIFELYLAVVDALHRREPDVDLAAVLVLADLLELAGAGDAVRQALGVDEKAPHLLARRGDGVRPGDLHPRAFATAAVIARSVYTCVRCARSSEEAQMSLVVSTPLVANAAALLMAAASGFLPASAFSASSARYPFTAAPVTPMRAFDT